jgi:hypothetical protein
VSQSFLRGALQDEAGLWDIAYVSLGIVTALLVFAALNIIALVWVDWATCAPRVILPTAEMPNVAVTIISCKPDVLALGQAFGLAAGAFSTSLLALAAYMAATRKPQGSSTTTTRVQETVVAAAPGRSATAADPLPVEVINADPVPVTETKPKRARKR